MKLLPAVSSNPSTFYYRGEEKCIKSPAEGFYDIYNSFKKVCTISPNGVYMYRKCDLSHTGRYSLFATYNSKIKGTIVYTDFKKGPLGKIDIINGSDRSNKVINHSRNAFVSYNGEVSSLNFEFDSRKRQWINKFIAYLILMGCRKSNKPIDLNRLNYNRFLEKSDGNRESYYKMLIENDEESKYNVNGSSFRITFNVKQGKLKIHNIMFPNRSDLRFQKEERVRINKVLRHNDHQFCEKDNELQLFLFIHRKVILSEILKSGNNPTSEFILQTEMKQLERNLGINNEKN